MDIFDAAEVKKASVMRQQDGSWKQILPDRKRIVMWGAADQARVNRPILEDLGCEIVVLIDDTARWVPAVGGTPVLRGWEDLNVWLAKQNPIDLGFVLAIGNPYGHVRCQLHERLQKIGLTSVSFADSSALIRDSAIVGEGLQVMPQAVIHFEANIHRQCIVNTRALVEHDCVLEDGVEIGPGVVLCGRVHVGTNTWVGAPRSVSIGMKFWLIAHLSTL
jgi:sugar O-acyltransferase (sialic acid O-acetyltransferase NeuD family)